MKAHMFGRTDGVSFLAQLVQQVLPLPQQTLLLALSFLAVALLCSRFVDDIGSTASTIMLWALCLWLGGALNVLSCTCYLGVLRVVARHVSCATAASRIRVAFESWGDEVLGLGVVGGVVFCDVASASASM